MSKDNAVPRLRPQTQPVNPPYCSAIEYPFRSPSEILLLSSGNKKRDRQSDSKALECARLILEGIVVVTRTSMLSYLETAEVYR